MLRLYKEKTFEAAHHIVGHKNPLTGKPGQCARPHGHSYTIGICVSANAVDPDTLFVLDYAILGAFLDVVKERYDHQDLNTLPDFQPPYKSTAECIAYAVHGLWEVMTTFPEANGVPSPIYGKVPTGIRVDYIRVSETGTTWAEYWPGVRDNFMGRGVV